MRFVIKGVIFGLCLFTALVVVSVVLTVVANTNRVGMVHPSPAPSSTSVDSVDSTAVPARAPSRLFRVKYEVIDPDPPKTGEWRFWIYYTDESGKGKKYLYNRNAGAPPGQPYPAFEPWTYSFVAPDGSQLFLSAEGREAHNKRFVVRIYVDGEVVAERTSPMPVVSLRLGD